jgi:hypothetical protein
MAKKKKKRSKSKAKPTKRLLSPAALRSASLTELKSELSRRKRHASALERRRTRLLEELGKLEAELIALGSLGGEVSRRPGRSRRRARGPNKKTLLVHLEEALSGKVLSVTEAAEAVMANGYHSSSKTFRTIVNQTLLANDVFERVGYGRYTRRS